MENEMRFIIIKTTAMDSIEISSAEAKTTKRKLHPSLRVDMTPMVDLGFLLITFFILTTSMMEKKAMKLVMPADGPATPMPESKVLSLVLTKDNQVYAYEGKFEDAVSASKIISTSYDENSGIGKLIRNKQQRLQQTDTKEGSEALILLIKPTPESSYKNVIDALDETTINGVKKFMLVDATEQERLQMKKMN